MRPGWRDLPERYGPWQTAYSRFYRWQKQGIWQKVLKELQTQKDACGGVGWEIHFVDRQHHKSPPARSRRKRGHQKGGRQNQALGTSRGGFSTKVHIKAEGLGKPLAFLVTEGERHESPVFEELVKQGEIKRKARGRARFRPRFLAADRAYANHRIRNWLRYRKIRPVIPKGGP